VGHTLVRIRAGRTVAYRPHATGRRSRQSGFTLVEVLVVLAILGMVAAVVVLSISGLAGRGAVEAANTEAHQVQSALIAYMQANNLSTWSGEVGTTGGDGVEHYILNCGRLQACYTVSESKIVDAYAYPDGKWAELTWNTGRCEWCRGE